VTAPPPAAPGPALRRVTKAVGHWLDAHATRGSRITVAVSGGADSLALAAATVLEAVRQGHPVAAATVDHGLQAGSDRQAARVADQLRGLGYPTVTVLPVRVTGSGGPEAAARRARYDALFPLAGDGAVLLGHTLDDQAETVLLGLSRGSGPRSIAGMAPFSAPWGRPLLGLRRADTEAACAEAGLAPWQDPHNDDPAFTRVRLRHEVLPLLEDVLGGGVAAALARTGQQLQEDADVLDGLGVDLARRALTGAAMRLDELQPAPAALRRRAIRWWLIAAGVSGLTADHLMRVDQLVADPGGVAAVRLPGRLDAVTDATTLRLRPAS
jgi:tRNA(Ile)-lysidine synthase